MVLSFHHPLQRLLVIAAGTVASSFVCAFAFVLLMAAFERGISGSFDLASVLMVIPGLSFGALPSALVVLPFALSPLWEARLARSFGIALAVALLVIGSTTPFIGWWAWPCAIVATLLALEFCRERFWISDASSTQLALGR